MRGLLAVLFAFVAVPVSAQPSTPCSPGGGVWSITTNTAILWVCASNGASWVQVGGAAGAAAWGNISGTLSAQTDLQSALDGKQAAGSYLAPNGNGGSLTGLTKSQVGLGNVDNTADSAKAVASAATLTTPRTINGTSFNGSANIVVTAAADTLTANTLASGVTSSSITTLGAAATLTTTGSLGYRAGAGGTVTQATSKATGVTLNKQCGDITMHNAALAAATIVSFTLTNSTIAATDVLVLNHVTTGTRGAYGLNAQAASGSAVIYVRNNTAGSLGEAIVIRFCKINGVTS